MKYSEYTTTDFVRDEYFQKWVLDSDAMTRNFWEHWLLENPEKRKSVEEAQKWVQLMARNGKALSRTDFNSMWQYVIEHRKMMPPKEPEKSIFFLRSRPFLLKVAVVITVFLGIAGGLYLAGMFPAEDHASGIPAQQITLELQDGTLMPIDVNNSGVITTGTGKKTVSQQKNVLVYDTGDSLSHKAESETVYNTLTVPYGKKFELQLSDGTHVFLNSGSVLRYPVMFLRDSPRDVFLDGEAFFTVARDKKRPFTVVTDIMKTRVYGTRFNVNSYKNENNTSAVLVEGSIGIYRTGNGQDEPVLMVPGQRAVLQNDTISIAQVNLDKYTGWTRGKLIFVDDRFEQISRELERHFNIRIDNRYTALNHKQFTGTFENESLEQILEIFREHTPFRYTLEDNTITIKPDNPKNESQ
ncbi:FecR family protein [Sinomicrobium soli]|uniref:FecR family protein n=1 Tax=Sinomicrobium sp. N-1-3-6 TaxID=2219864 RepID=UPI000DCF1141|nr:FecR domain-containing protein [Sinomicrobium sp. N-1-3-6]RAV30535.1 hypothetical protein DN748_03290 [Sinomicrobium sp. N-1-3-6]